MDIQERCDRLDRMIESGNLLRGQWTDGQERACLLAALSPECGEQQSAQACPATLMPRWLSELTPWIDDSGTVEKWPEHVKRYAACARRWNRLDSNAWRRLDYTIRAISVREARTYVKSDDSKTLKAIDDVLSRLDREASGEHLIDSWSAAESAAWTAAESAAESAAGSAAGSAAESAAWTAARTAAESAAESAAWTAARSAAEDRLIDGILTAIEKACDETEGKENVA